MVIGYPWNMNRDASIFVNFMHEFSGGYAKCKSLLQAKEMYGKISIAAELEMANYEKQNTFESGAITKS